MTKDKNNDKLNVIKILTKLVSCHNVNKKFTFILVFILGLLVGIEWRIEGLEFIHMVLDKLSR